MAIGISSALDIAIGVTFLLLLVSMIVSFANEVISKTLQWRSQNLKDGIANLLSDPDGKALAGLIYDHPMIRSLGHTKAPDKFDNPSYIPAERFAQVLTEVIGQAAAESQALQGATRDGQVLERGSPEGQEETTRVAAGSHGALSRAVDTGFPVAAPREVLQDARSLVASLPDGEARTNLLLLANQAEGNLDAFQTSVATWFDDGMDRVSGWYKRKVQKCLFVLSVVVVVVLNVNVFEIAEALRTQPQLTAELVEMAQEFNDGDAADATATEQNAEEVANTLKQLDAMTQLPLGWDEVPNLANVLRSIPGWLVTAVLASLGAPFWFNFLGQLLDIRGSGKPPAKPERVGSS